jgi:hypothetical protein
MSVSQVLAGFLIIALANAGGPLAYAAGGDNSGGGHGVVSPTGEIVVLDLSEDSDEATEQSCSEIEKEEVDISREETLKEATRMAANRLFRLNKSFGLFYVRLFNFIRSGKLKWHFTQTPLAIYPDYSIPNPARMSIVQLARQCGRGQVIIQKDLFQRLSTVNQAALLIHEILLAKLGLGIPRSALRSAVKAIMGEESLLAAKLTTALNPVAPEILAGEYTIYAELNKLEGVATIKIRQPQEVTTTAECRGSYVTARSIAGKNSIYNNYPAFVPSPIWEIEKRFSWADRWDYFEWERNYSTPIIYLSGCHHTVLAENNPTNNRWFVSIEDQRKFASLGLSFLDGVFGSNKVAPTSYRIFINNVLYSTGNYDFKDGSASLQIPVELW